MRDALIDPQEFPFKESELCAALMLLQGEALAWRESATHAAGMRWEVAERAVFQARLMGPHPARAEGEVGASFGCGMYMWYPAEALALLTLLDEGLAVSVRAHRLARRLADRPRRERPRTRFDPRRRVRNRHAPDDAAIRSAAAARACPRGTPGRVARET